MFRDKDIIEDNDFFYWKNSKHNLSRAGQTQYVVCKFHRDPFMPCMARGKIVGDHVVLSEGSEHSCDPSEDLAHFKNFKKALRTAVDDDPRRTAFKVYTEVARRHFNGSVLYPFAVASSTLQRWISKSRPPVPENFEEYYNSLMSDIWRERYTQRDKATLTIRNLVAADGSRIILYTDIGLVHSLPVIEKIALDATFKVCPKRPEMRQFLTIMTLVNNVWEPFAWAIMTRKTIPAYASLLAELREIYNDILRPSEFMMDYEDALKAAISRYFPNAIIVHCYFHHCQADTKRLGRYHGKVRSYNALKEWPRAKLFMRKLLALALLPANCIEEAFHDLVGTADADILVYFRDLIAYYGRYWLTVVGPQRFSVYNQSQRTNNALEAHHRVLGEFLMGHRRNIWIFTDCILDVVVKTWREVESMKKGLPVRRPTEAKYIQSAAMLEKAWDLFVRNRDVVEHRKFLTAASHIFDGFGGDLVCQNVDQIEQFEHVDSYEHIVEMFADEIHSYRIQNENQDVHVLHRTGCLTCNCKFLATHVSLPCYHWAGCRICVQRAIQLAVVEEGMLACSVCNGVIEWVVELDQERQISR